MDSDYDFKYELSKIPWVCIFFSFLLTNTANFFRTIRLHIFLEGATPGVAMRNILAFSQLSLLIRHRLIYVSQCVCVCDNFVFGTTGQSADQQYFRVRVL